MGKKFNIGDKVIESTSLREGTIVAYTLRDEQFAFRHSYKIRWDGMFAGEEWKFQQFISKIEKIEN